MPDVKRPTTIDCKMPRKCATEVDLAIKLLKLLPPLSLACLAETITNTTLFKNHKTSTRNSATATLHLRNSAAHEVCKRMSKTIFRH